MSDPNSELKLSSFWIKGIVIAVVALVFFIGVWVINEKISERQVSLGQRIAKPKAEIIYQVTDLVSDHDEAVVAIPHDKHYTSNTLHRVLILVNQDVRFVGATFVRSSKDKRDHLMTPFEGVQLEGWIEVMEPQPDQ